MSNPATSLPPGFRFHPTDEELILHYLRCRAASAPCPVSIIAEVDIYKFDPWDLPAKAMFGDREWYFFSPRDRKYPNGIRPNRAAGSGYWKATGTDKPILAANNESIGVKKALVFYKGRPPKGIKTNWIMHEYRLAEAGNTNTYKPLKLRDHSMRLDDWVLCRIYKKSNTMSPSPTLTDQEQESSCTEDTYYNIHQQQNTAKIPKTSSISEFLEDYAALSNLFDTQPELPEFNSLLTNPSPNLEFLNASNNGNGIYSSYLVPPRVGGECVGPRMEHSNGSNMSCGSPSKRQRTGEGLLPEASRSQNDSCLVTTAGFSGQFVDVPQAPYNMFSQQLLLNSHFGLH